MAQACLTKRIPYLGFGLAEAHVVELEKYLFMWVKDMMCTEGHPLCRKGVAAAKAKAVAQVAPAADKQHNTTEQDNNKKDKHDSKDKGNNTFLRGIRGGRGQHKYPRRRTPISPAQQNASSPRRGPATRAAARNFEQDVPDLALPGVEQQAACQRLDRVCKGDRPG